MADDEDLVLRALRGLADQAIGLNLAEHEDRDVRRQDAFLACISRVRAGERGENAADDPGRTSLTGSSGRLLDGLDRLDRGAVEIDAYFSARVFDQALAVFHVGIDGRGARAAFLAAIRVAFVVNFFAFDFGDEIGARLLRELRRQW